MTVSPARVIDTADWSLVVPVRPALDLTGSRLTATLAPGLGGPAVATISSDDGSIAWTADPVTGLSSAITLSVPLAVRGAWVAFRPTPLGFDIHRTPPGSTADEWLGRSNFLVLPGSDSAGAAGAGGFEYSGSQQPTGRALLPVIQVGPQGAQGIPGRDGNAITTVIVQPEPAAVWTLVHGQNGYPGVTLVDTAGDRFDADTRYVDANTIIVQLGFPTAGTAYLN